MNINVATQNQGVIAWRAITAANLNPAIDIRQHNNFGFTFNVTADIAVEAIFEVIICSGPWGVTPNPKSQIHIPVGTKAGSICTATLPCKPDAFIQLEAVSGDTGKIEVVAVLGGPR
jgi:hypothetical protein